MSRFARRTFLLGAAGGLASLPFARMLSRADSTFPTRLVIFFTADGFVHDAWRPTGGERDFALSEILEPLARHRSAITLLDGLDMRSSYPEMGAATYGHGHQRGMGSMLTGREILPGEFYTGGGWASGISVDQHIARALGATTPHASIELAVQPAYLIARPLSRMVYLGPERPVAPIYHPVGAFDSVFGSYVPDRAERDRRRNHRGSVLDFVRAEANALRPSLGALDRQRLDAHLEGVRSIERRLDPAWELGGTCTVPDGDGFAGPTRAREEAPRITDLMLDLTVQALACDLTRVISVQIGDSRNTRPYPWLAASRSTENHHALSHLDKSIPEVRETLVAIDRWHAERFADLLDRMAAIPEGDGTLLDHSVVLWTNCLSDGARHSRMGMSYVVAGGGNGYLGPGGRFLDFTDRPEPARSHNNLLLSLCHAMGLEDETFGDERWCTGPLERLARV